jgi:hypothetical protein
VPLASGDDGRFEGSVSASGQALAQGWRVEVQGLLPPVTLTLPGVLCAAALKDQPAWCELTLAAATISGTVLSEEGQARGGVDVRCESLERVWQAGIATSDAQGRFRFVDLPPGRYRVSAEGAEPQDVAVEGVDQEVQFVVRPPVEFQGRVLADDRPVSGAWVHFWRAPGVALDPVLTGADGRFEVRLPADLGEVGVTVRPPGYALKMTRLPLGDADALTLSVEKAWGRLALDVSGEDPVGRVVLLAHGSALEAVESLNGWANDNGAGRSGDRLVVPRVEPGEYALCSVAPLDVGSLWSGEATPELCTMGTLAAGGSLVLTLPGP